MMTKRTLIQLFSSLLLIVSSLSFGQDNDSKWIGTWAASPMPSVGPFSSSIELENQTLRQVIYSSVGGEQIKVRISNVFGSKDLEVGAASIALQDKGKGIISGSHRSLAFSGQTSIIVPAGAFVFSDPVNLTTDGLSNISISLYFPGATGPSTSHSEGLQTGYISTTGNYTQQGDFPVAVEVQNVSFLTGVQVLSSNDTKLLVAFGDSITDGTTSTPNTNSRWPNFLARRIAAEAPSMNLGILNHGIAGNRVLHDTIAQNALARFGRDVLSWPNLSHIVVMIGINDLGFPAIPNAPFGPDVHSSDVSADELIAGYRQMIARAHAHGVKIIGATLTPFNGASYFSDAGEVKRQAINSWIRESGEYDAIIDFDQAIRNPNDPSRMQEALQSGDWLHPNDAGYEVMANTIELSVFE